MSIHDEIIAQMEIYVTENKKFVEKGVKSSATRARKALAEISRLCKERRSEIQEAREKLED